MSQKQTYPITSLGYKRIQNEYNRLIREERPKVIDLIADARGFGDLSENAEYDSAKETQAMVEGKISELSDKLARAEVIDPSKIQSSRVVFGATVKLFDVDSDCELTYQIVGEDEADIKQGKISINSPVARALIGSQEDDEVIAETPSGEKVFEVIEIIYR